MKRGAKLDNIVMGSDPREAVKLRIVSQQSRMRIVDRCIERALKLAGNDTVRPLLAFYVELPNQQKHLADILRARQSEGWRERPRAT